MPGFSFRRIGQGDDCPVCGRRIYYGLWSHVETCLKEKQRKADEEAAYEHTPELKAQIREGYEAYQRGECRPIDEFMAELEAECKR